MEWRDRSKDETVHEVDKYEYLMQLYNDRQSPIGCVWKRWDDRCYSWLTYSHDTRGSTHDPIKAQEKVVQQLLLEALTE